MTHCFYVIFKSSLYVILWYAFMNKLTEKAKKTYRSLVNKNITVVNE